MLTMLAQAEALRAEGMEWHEEWGALVIQRHENLVVVVQPLMFTAAIITSRENSPVYLDRWCYHSVAGAVAAAQAWDLAAQPEPDGWHRHPTSGRRRDAQGRLYKER